MIKKLVHYSDLHVRLFKDHQLYKSILEEAFKQWKDIAPDTAAWRLMQTACKSKSK